MFLDNNKDKTIYTLVNNYSVSTAFQLILEPVFDFPCLEDLNDIGIIYKNVLYNLSELSKVAIDEIFITIGSCKRQYKGNKLLRNTIEEFRCKGV